MIFGITVNSYYPDRRSSRWLCVTSLRRVFRHIDLDQATQTLVILSPVHQLSCKSVKVKMEWILAEKSASKWQKNPELALFSQKNLQKRQ